MADHGTRQCYADGCRLPECKAAQAKYMREYKARKAGATVTDIRAPGRPKKGAVPTVPVSVGQPAEAGPNERAVLEELATLTSAETRKGVAAGALTMARILDNPLALAQQPSAFAKLQTALDDLRKGSARKRGRLASVQAMTKTAATGTDA